MGLEVPGSVEPLRKSREDILLFRPLSAPSPKGLPFCEDAKVSSRLTLDARLDLRKIFVIELNFRGRVFCSMVPEWTKAIMGSIERLELHNTLHYSERLK